MSSRDVDILEHSISSICDRKGRLFCKVCFSSIFEGEAASVRIRSLHFVFEVIMVTSKPILLRGLLHAVSSSM